MTPRPKPDDNPTHPATASFSTNAGTSSVEALAAFANTAGGVVIWGLTCKKDGRKVDQITAAVPIDAPEQWAQKLHDWQLESTSPPVGGVRIEVMRHRNEDKGYVVCFIPESRDKPHCAEFVENKPYFIRVGDKCKVPNPSLLRSLFYPSRPKPRFEFLLTVERPTDVGEAVRLVGKISNMGASTANNVYCVLEDVGFVRLGVIEPGVEMVTTSTGNGFILGRPLHSGMSVRLFFAETRDEQLEGVVHVYSTDNVRHSVWFALEPYKDDYFWDDFCEFEPDEGEFGPQ